MKMIGIIIAAALLVGCPANGNVVDNSQTYYEVTRYAADKPVDRYLVTQAYFTNRGWNSSACAYFNKQWIQLGDNTKIRVMPDYHGPEKYESLVK